ncbi:uridine kinase family protein [Streptomyces sp. BH097]|uniref:uridine kinase family protein n=1 Tax=unclassified Streptomyces TaxID=2593676 RepID=UPI003BB4B530
MSYHHAPLADCADRIRRLPPSCGPVRLIGIDGHAGSGKSTLATRLAGALGGAPVLRLDDLASHDALFAWTERLRTQVLAPLSRGEAARYETYDWHARRYAAVRELPAADVVLIEGVGVGRSELRPELAMLLWLDMPGETAWARGRARDGEEQREFWDGWIPAEREHFKENPSLPFAHLLVRECPEGYEVRKGPGGIPPLKETITHRDGPPAVR